MLKKELKSGPMALNWLFNNVKGLTKDHIYVEYKRLAPFLIIIPMDGKLKRINENSYHFDDLAVKLQEWVDTGVYDDHVYISPYTTAGKHPDWNSIYTGEVFKCRNNLHGYKDINGKSDLVTEYRTFRNSECGFERVARPKVGDYVDFVSGMFGA